MTTDHGIPNGAYASITPDDAYQRLVESLSRSQSKLQDAEAIGRIGHWDWDVKLDALWWTEGFSNIIAVDDEDIAAPLEHFLSLVHPQDQEHVKSAFEAVAAKYLKTFDIEARVASSKGSEGYFHIRGAATLNAQGDVKRIQGIIHDITRKYQIQKIIERENAVLERRVRERTSELEKSQAVNQAIVDSAASGVVTLNAEGLIQSMNFSAEAIFAMEAENAHGLHVSVLIPDLPFPGTDNGEALFEPAPGHANIGQTVLESYGLTLAGAQVPLEIAASEVSLESETLYTLLLQDITARREIHESLVTAKRSAELTSRAKSQFLSAISHELRTPLNSIIGFAQLIKSDIQEQGPEADSEYVDQILNGGRHLLSLINEVLDLAAIEAGKVTLNMEPVDLNEVIGNCWAMAEGIATNRDLTIEGFDTIHEVPMVIGDPARLTQVLLNLVSNAVKYNRQGGRVWLSVEGREDSFVRLGVHDSGIGIPEIEHATIFQPFSRVTNLNDAAVDGTGIGLTITKELVERMGGHIGFDSTPGVGSVFWVDLMIERRKVAREPEPRDNTEFPRSGLEPRPEGTNEDTALVLYVEDNDANRKLMEGLFRRHERLVLICAPTGELGVEMALRHQPDLMLIDINLPGISGIEMADQLRNNAITNQTPMIALSANATEHDKKAGKTAGFNRYLTKPIDLNQVEDTIFSFLGER